MMSVASELSSEALSVHSHLGRPSWRFPGLWLAKCCRSLALIGRHRLPLLKHGIMMLFKSIFISFLFGILYIYPTESNKHNAHLYWMTNINWTNLLHLQLLTTSPILFYLFTWAEMNIAVLWRIINRLS